MILITAFEPFGERKENTSLSILNRLENRYDKLVLPVSVKKIYQVLDKKNLNDYDFIVMLGEADRPHISLEKFAYNELTMRIIDNDGYQVQNETIIESGLTYQTSLDLTRFEDDKTFISTDPGRYLCNMGYYLALNKTKRVLFIHVSTVDTLEQFKRIEEIIHEIEQISKSW